MHRKRSRGSSQRSRTHRTQGAEIAHNVTEAACKRENEAFRLAKIHVRETCRVTKEVPKKEEAFHNTIHVAEKSSEPVPQGSFKRQKCLRFATNSRSSEAVQDAGESSEPVTTICTLNQQ